VLVMSPASFRWARHHVKADRVRSVIRRLLRIGLLLGVVAAIAVALSRLLESRTQPADLSTGEPTEPWPRLSDPSPSWVEPTGAMCPTSHPVKAKLSSKIFHLPGSASYDRTHPDRCYVDADAAEADGLRAAKR
jgi:hypothetical protein